MEVNNESLKQQSKQWWSEHSQDYVADNKHSHLGAKIELPDADFLAYLEDLDANFKRQAYFAQKRPAPLFSKLIAYDSLKGKKVLEIGCGLGSHSEMLARSGAQLTAIDLSPTSVASTKRRLHLKQLTADVRVADAENLPFADESFDYIWSWGVIHHSPNTRKCAEEIERVLKPGGKLQIMLYHRHSLYNWVNVIFRFGILKAKLLSMSIQDLHNHYTDGRYIGGAPLSKYYTRKQITHDLFKNLTIDKQIAFEQKKAVSFIIPSKFRNNFEKLIPDGLYTWIFSRLGFLLLTTAHKPNK